MPLNERAIAIEAAERLGWDLSTRLRIQSMIPAALSNLAKAVAKDPSRRNLLLTNPNTVTSDDVVVENSGSYLDLSALIASNGIMLDYIRNGTIFLNNAVEWDTGDVETGGPNTITINSTPASLILTTGTKVRLAGLPASTLPSGLVAETDYYIVATGTDYGFATSLADALTGTLVTIASSGTGVGGVITTQDVVILQWLMSPSQGSTTSCLPFSYWTGWLQGTLLYMSGFPVVEEDGTVSSTLSFNVPYVPTSTTFPDDEYLYSDLLDTLVAVCSTMAISDLEPSDN